MLGVGWEAIFGKFGHFRGIRDWGRLAYSDGRVLGRLAGALRARKM